MNVHEWSGQIGEVIASCEGVLDAGDASLGVPDIVPTTTHAGANVHETHVAETHETSTLMIHCRHVEVSHNERQEIVLWRQRSSFAH
ncbi:MAG: hypothetical protein JW955_22070 [Sedimentisphaerales bacterium]|nr:hypothetical protein [Sedimentisphaerales bacterium]